MHMIQMRLEFQISIYLRKQIFIKIFFFSLFLFFLGISAFRQFVASSRSRTNFYEINIRYNDCAVTKPRSTWQPNCFGLENLQTTVCIAENHCRRSNRSWIVRHKSLPRENYSPTRTKSNLCRFKSNSSLDLNKTRDLKLWLFSSVILCAFLALYVDKTAKEGKIDWSQGIPKSRRFEECWWFDNTRKNRILTRFTK